MARDAGELALQAMAEHNLSLTYARLGLFHRAWRLIRHSIALRERPHRRSAHEHLGHREYRRTGLR